MVPLYMTTEINGISWNINLIKFFKIAYFKKKIFQNFKLQHFLSIV